MATLLHLPVEVDETIDLDLYDEPSEPRVPFADWIEVQAALYRSRPGSANAWLAAAIDDLADKARLVGATTPDEYDGRIEVLDEDRDVAIRDEMFQRGVQFARRHA